MSSSAFRSQRPFGCYLPIARYGTIFAAKWSSNVVSMWLAQGHKGLNAHRCSFVFALFCVTDHTTKLGMKDLLKAQQWWVERDSNLLPPQYRANALSVTPCSLSHKIHANFHNNCPWVYLRDCSFWASNRASPFRANGSWVFIFTKASMRNWRFSGLITSSL